MSISYSPQKSVLFIGKLLCSFLLSCQLHATYDYDIAICGIFWNEARFMKEWIEFHKLVGVQHFYLYNNSSSDNFKIILSPYIKNGEVELIDWNYRDNNKHADNIFDDDTDTGTTRLGTTFQTDAYNDALIRCRGKTKWIAFLDLDEFLFPVQTMTLQEILHSYESFGGVTANWVCFGTSNIDKIPASGFSIEYLLKGLPNKHVKSIVRPERVSQFINMHYAIYKNGYFAVSEENIRCDGPFNEKMPIKKLRINHYWSRDGFNFMTHKLQSRMQKHCGKENYCAQIEYTRKMCLEAYFYDQHGIEDTTILKYLPNLKINMSFNK